MAVSDSNTNDAEKSTKEAQKPKEKKERPLTKVVVRRLPPGMDQESFLVQVSPIPDYDYMYLVKGDMTLGENAFARAYINFVNATDIFMFKEKFDNYVFVDQKGHEYPAVVEFASFQKIPRKRKPRPDPKAGTIESDPYYLEFLESLKEQPSQDVKPEFSYQFSLDSKDEIASTPLLDYIKQRRIDKQRIREERREERRKKELERKKLREDERKRHEQKAPGKTIVRPITTSRSSKAALDSVKEEASEKADTKIKSDDEKEDSLSEKNISPAVVNKDQKYDDRKQYLKSKQRFPPRTEKPDYSEKKEYKNRRDDYREKEYRSRRYDDYKREPDSKQTPRRTKKYSEKREERKNEARKAEQKKIEEADKSNTNADITSGSGLDECNVKNVSDKAEEKEEQQNNISEPNNVNEKLKSKKQSVDNTENHLEHQTSVEEESASETKHYKESKYRNKDDDPRMQRRIRNKDRPTMELYQPGKLSKRKPVDGTDAERNTTTKE